MKQTDNRYRVVETGKGQWSTGNVMVIAAGVELEDAHFWQSLRPSSRKIQKFENGAWV